MDRHYAYPVAIVWSLPQKDQGHKHCVNVWGEGSFIPGIGIYQFCGYQKTLVKRGIRKDGNQGGCKATPKFLSFLWFQEMASTNVKELSFTLACISPSLVKCGSSPGGAGEGACEEGGDT